MFLSGYEELRNYLLRLVEVSSLLHLGSKTFPEIGGEVVQNAAFVLRITPKPHDGIYFRLIQFDSTNLKSQKFLEAIQNSSSFWRFQTHQKAYDRIPGSPFAYWLTEGFYKSFEFPTLKNFIDLRAGLQTGENSIFLRLWHEVQINSIGNGLSDIQARPSEFKWFPYNKGGSFKRWYGNRNHVVNWYKDGLDIKNDKLEKLEAGKCLPSNAKPKNVQYYFRESITWSIIGASNFSVRYSPQGSLFDIGGASGFAEKNLKFFLGLLNSKVAKLYLDMFNPTINIQPGDLASIPVVEKLFEKKDYIEGLVQQCIDNAKCEWDLHEYSLDFSKYFLLHLDKHNKESIQSLLKDYEQKCQLGSVDRNYFVFKTAAAKQTRL